MDYATVQLKDARSRESHPSETLVGGIYLYSDGVTLVNAFNQKIDENGNILDTIPLPHR
jgi:hypothetical protein